VQTVNRLFFGCIVVTTISLGFCPIQAVGQTGIDLPEIRVTSRRLPESPITSMYASTHISRYVLNRSPGTKLDDVLRQVPGFGLFRRQSSRAAHPTTQGVSLRGLGPNGAGRTLVLLDGIPQNDPFGGWIDWSRLPAVAIDTVSVLRGGGSGPWGNAALAGVIRLESIQPDEAGGWLNARLGSRESFDITAFGQRAIGSGYFFGLAHGHSTNGYYVVPKRQRGIVDSRAATRGGGLRAGFRYNTESDTRVFVDASYSNERLINGNSLARAANDTYESSISAINGGRGAKIAWEGHAYIRHKEFDNNFVSVSTLRDSARSVLDQFDVPATAAGGNIIFRLRLDSGFTTEFGSDVRYAEGETNELFRNLGQGFTRKRSAGGKQWVAGVFAEGHWQLLEATRVTLGLRADHWRQGDGHRVETNLDNNAVLRETEFDDHGGWVGNLRIGVRTELAANLFFRAAGYSGFRVPTINELYRPFRVGKDITEANSELDPERLYGGEVALQWSPTTALRLSSTYFLNQLHDPVANVTIRTEPGFDSVFGTFVPQGGSLRQRRNLNRVKADGLELELSADLHSKVRVSAAYLNSNPRIKRNSGQTSLEGKRLAQVARHQGTIAVAWEPKENFMFRVQGRFATKQFEDDLNTRALAGFTVVDIYGEYVLNQRIRLHINAENVFDETVEVGESSNGLLTVGSPASFLIGLHTTF